MTDIDHRRLARELLGQQRRRRMFMLLGLLVVAILAATYLRCGKGWGTGGKGAGDGGTTAPTTPPNDAAARCSLRLTAAGITVDGKQATRDEAIAACKGKAGADVLVTGDARQGDWDELRGALDAASIPFFAREPRGVTPPDGGAVPTDS